MRIGQTLASIADGRGGCVAATSISRVTVRHSAGALARVSCACHLPAAGEATSASQKYGGPPRRSREVAATLPFGAISDSSPSSGFSAAKITRSGAPFHGRHRGGQDREFGRVVAASGLLGLRPHIGDRDEGRAGDCQP